MAKLAKLGAQCIQSGHRDAHCFFVDISAISDHFFNQSPLMGFGEDLNILALKLAKLAKLDAQCIQSGHRGANWFIE